MFILKVVYMNVCSETHTEVILHSPICSTPISAPVTPSTSRSESTNASPQLLVGTADASWADRMIIPWHKMPRGVSEAISQKARPVPSDRRAMINLVVEEMLLCHPNPNLKQVTQVAKRIVRQYPESFEDRADEGQRIGTGCASLAKQLKCRVENETRGATSVRLRRPKSKRGIENDEPSTPTSATRQSKQPKDSYGCINWHPRKLPNNETRETLQAAQLELLEQHNLGHQLWNADKINTLMKKNLLPSSI